MTPIIIPQLDANVVDVTITQWRKQVGDAVKKGEIIAVLTTDKAAYDFESPASGFLLSIVAQLKSIVPTGSVIGAIGEAGEKVEEGACASPTITQGQQDARTEGTGHCACPPAQPRIRATPRARRLALEKGFDLAAVCAVVGVEIIDESAIAAYEQKKGEQS
jgi:pyruvate/2-oxoglutarate dehydrogenase complex dihydrolipoamide acyltransferase (E2) component